MSTQTPVSAHEMPLLRTKLYIPSLRPEWISRPRLVERLNAGQHRKLTLISAPAGFGKTTLVSEWLASCQQPAAWLSLEESDNDPTRFLSYLIAALQTVEAGIGKGASSALHSPQPPPTETILATLINEIAGRPERMILVLDDYHLIKAQPIHDALTFLLWHLPPDPGPGTRGRGLHLVIATRDDPLLPLSRLRARGQLSELRAADLRFSTSEAADFLNQAMGLDLGADDISALETRTEGWIAGLQLAAVSMQGRKDVTGFVQSFTGSHHFVLDYLIQEVLEQQSDEVKAFLLRTSILDRLTGPLCDAVRFGIAETRKHSDRVTSSGATGEDSQAILEKLQRANLFIVPLDDERRWYRYHHLFADLLRQRLRQNPPLLSSPPLGEKIAVLHTRASEWYAHNGFINEAIEHALRAGDVEQTIRLLDDYADTLWKRGEHAKLGRWLYELPNESLAYKPRLCIFGAWYLFANGQQERAEWVLQVTEQILDRRTERLSETAPLAQDRPPDSEITILRGRVAAVRALMGTWWGNGPELIRQAGLALDYLPQDDPWRGPAAVALGDAYEFQGDLPAAYQARLEAIEACKAVGDIYFEMIANLKLVSSLRGQGRLPQIVEICQQQVQLAQESGLSQTPIAGWTLAVWAETLAELNHLDEALQRAKQGVELTEGGDLALLGWSYLCLIAVLFARDDLDGVQKTLAKMKDLARQYDLPPSITSQMVTSRARLLLKQNNLEAASQWARDRELDVKGTDLVREGEYIVFAHLFIAQDQPDEATSLLRRLLKAAETGGRISSLIEILVLQALAFQTGGDTGRAITVLSRALTLAEPGGFVRTFVNKGPPMASLLYEAMTRDIAPKYTRRLLSAFPQDDPEQAKAPAQDANAGLIEPLSERELEVVQLLAEGLTNPEIASRLYLSLNTVKAHTRNIYGKLGVNNRTQASVRARTLGILAPHRPGK